MRIDELVRDFLPRRPGLSPAEVAARITDLVVAYVRRDGEPMPGVPEAIALFGGWSSGSPSHPPPRNG